MSPVSPKPCSITTAGPVPPTRTKYFVPLVSIIWVRKPAGNGWTAAEAGATKRTAEANINSRSILELPHFPSALYRMRRGPRHIAALPASLNKPGCPGGGRAAGWQEHRHLDRGHRRSRDGRLIQERTSSAGAAYRCPARPL